MKTLLRFLAIFLFGFFSCYVLSIGYFRFYQIDNSIKNYYGKIELFRESVERGEWSLANMAVRELRELNPNRMKVQDLKFSDFVFSGLLGFSEEVLVDKEVRDREISFYENQIPIEKRIK